MTRMSPRRSYLPWIAITVAMAMLMAGCASSPEARPTEPTSKVDGGGPAPAERPRPNPTSPVVLPIEYPVGEELPDLGDTPGPLAAIWLVPGVGGGGPEIVGLVAETGRFGTLPIDVSSSYMAGGSYFALSPDGRRIAYDTPAEELAVRDLVSGERYSPTFEFEPRPERWYTWIDATHLVGHDVRGSEDDGWVWQPGTAPKVISILAYVGTPYLGAYAGRDPWFFTPTEDGDPRKCPSLQDLGKSGTTPMLCDVVGVIDDETALTHDGTGAVIALDIRGVEDPDLRRVVATAGGPPRVTFATDLIGEALGSVGGAS
jgi:hypothetical protein